MTIQSNLRVIQVTNAEQLLESHRVRIAVFVDEQRFDLETEVDAIDASCTHWLLMDSTAGDLTVDPRGCGVGAIRLVPAEPDHPHTVHLGRLCVLKTHRNRGLSKLLVQAFLDHCKAHRDSIRRIALTSQMDKVQFYEKFGFVVDDPKPVDVDGAPHIHMSMEN